MMRWLSYLSSTLLCLCVSCDTDLYVEECVYPVVLRYDYNEENTTTENKILYWVSNISEYIFDEEGILCYPPRIVTEQICNEYLDSPLELGPGRYSVLAIGNIDGRSYVWDSATGNEKGAPQVGVTRREDMRMSLDDAFKFDDGTSGPSEELFYGYRTFSVGEFETTGQIRVDMINAHFQLRFRVTWKNRPTLPSVGTYYAVLEDIPSEYELMPEYVYLPGNPVAEQHDPGLQDLYPTRDNEVIHYIPYTEFEEKNILTYSNSTYLNADYEVWGKFVGYRAKEGRRLVLKLYYTGDGNTISEDDPMVLPREIDLQQYFQWFQYELDYTLKQEYVLDIVVNGNTIQISPLEGLTIADWSDGGYL